MKKIKIIVTGGYGFIGSHFISLALKNGLEVINLDLKTYAANFEVIKKFQNIPKLTNIIGDIADFNLVTKILNDIKPDGLINFAAETHVDNSIDNAEKFIKTNITGTYTLLRASTSFFKKNPDKNFKFVQVSTDEVFGSLGKKGEFDENSPISPRNPYSASKASADHLVSSWFNTYSLPTIITNCSNNFGPNQNSEKLIPKTILSIIKKEKIKVYGDGKNVRDWLYVQDHVTGVLNLFEKGKIGHRYCIGGGQELSNIELVSMICEIVDKKLNSKLSSKNLIQFVTDRLGHDFRYAINDKKIRLAIGYENDLPFQTALSRTVYWYLNYFFKELKNNNTGDMNE